VATEAAWLNGKMEKIMERAKKLLTGIGLLMEGLGGLVPSARCYSWSMLCRVSRITVTLALITCLVCPLIETFDNWDHTIQTGNDTEYTLVVLALCVGVAYSFARFILKRALLTLVAKDVIPSFTQTVLSFERVLTSLLFDATSPPPPLYLRI
jgi:hypothetical protein